MSIGRQERRDIHDLATKSTIEFCFSWLDIVCLDYIWSWRDWLVHVHQLIKLHPAEFLKIALCIYLPHLKSHFLFTVSFFSDLAVVL